MEFIFEYGIFLAKTATVLAGLVFALIAIAAVGQKYKKSEKLGHIEVKSLNDKFQDMKDVMQASILSEFEYGEVCKNDKKKNKEKHKEEKLAAKGKALPSSNRSRVFVIDFKGDIKASATESLAEQVSAVLTQARPEDEVVVCLESSGGMVHSYGLASSQLSRIKDRGIPLTVCVDKVAASGGYMMACIANKIISAPFALIGSIGVVAQIPNFNRLLKKHDIDYEMLTAGEYKRTLTVLGENTEKGRQKFQQEIQDTHNLFKDFVLRNRPVLDISQVATGEVWFGVKALEYGLVDEIRTSDDYLFLRHNDADLYQISWIEKHSIAEKLGFAAESAFERVLMKVLNNSENRSFFFR